MTAIYLTLNGRSGVFLPQVARETGWRRDQLLDRLCTEKDGLPRRILAISNRLSSASLPPRFSGLWPLSPEVSRLSWKTHRALLE